MVEAIGVGVLLLLGYAIGRGVSYKYYPEDVRAELKEFFKLFVKGTGEISKEDIKLLRSLADIKCSTKGSLAREFTLNIYAVLALLPEKKGLPNGSISEREMAAKKPLEILSRMEKKDREDSGLFSHL